MEKCSCKKRLIWIIVAVVVVIVAVCFFICKKTKKTILRIMSCAKIYASNSDLSTGEHNMLLHNGVVPQSVCLLS